MKTRVVVACAAVGLGLLAAGPVQADPVSGGTAAPDSVIYEKCQYEPISYEVTLPPDADYFELDIEVETPDGTVDPAGFVATPFGDPQAGVVNYVQCYGASLPGTYTITASGSYEVADTSYPYTLPDSTFTSRLAGSKTTASANRAGVRVRVRDERPRGYFATQFPVVYLERRVDHSWKKIPGSRTYLNFRGRGLIVFLPRHRTRVRAVTLTHDNYTGSTSRPVTVPARGY